MVKIICLANSKKYGDRCIAGIDIETGKWVRPIYTHSTNPKDGRIPRKIRLINGEEVKLLDVIDIPLDESGEDFGFESENLNILPGQWEKIREASPSELLKFLDNQSILHDCSKFITIPFLQSIPFEQRKTIQLVYTQKLQITGSKDKWKGSIENDVNCKLKEASITDLELINKLNSGYISSNSCLVTVSLSMPYNPIKIDNWEHGAVCWKLIAGVIELSDPNFG